MFIIKFLRSFIASKRDKELKELVENSYESVRVVGRGTIIIDPKEIRESSEFKKAQIEFAKIIERE